MTDNRIKAVQKKKRGTHFIFQKVDEYTVCLQS